MTTKFHIFRQVLRNCLLFALCTFTLLLSGCLPEEFVLWAPDGNHALVQGSKGTFLIDANGKILREAIEGEQWLEEPWMPDSRHIIVVRAVKAKSFQEYRTLLGEQRADAAYNAAATLLKAMRRYQGELGDFPFATHAEAADHFKAAYSGEGGLDPMPVLYAIIADRHPEEFVLLAKKFGEPTPTMEELVPPIYELVIRNALPSDAPYERVLMRSVDEIHWVRSAPNGKHIAFVQNDPVRPGLYIVSATKDGTPVRIDQGAMTASWTPDGQSLVYAKTRLPYLLVKNETQLGTITRRAVLDAEGNPFSEPRDAEDLAGILFHPEGRVACLPDGRILFASAELKLPASADKGGNVSLNALSAGETISIEPLVSAEKQTQLPNRPDRFSLSPDGKHVAVTSNSGGAVTVLSLTTGELITIQEKVPAWSENSQTEFRPAPTWRSATELCYIAPAGHAATGAKRSEVVLHQLGGKARALSRSWADGVGSFLRVAE